MKHFENPAEIEKDEFFHHFLSKSEHKNELISSLTISDQIHKLSEGLEYISQELQTQVRNNHGALLSQSTHAIQLDLALNSVDTCMNTILNSAKKLRNQLNTQHNLVKSETFLLDNLHNTSHILRACSDVLHLTKKLKNNSKDVLAQAELLYQLECYTENEDLKNIYFIQEELSFVTTTRQKLQNRATIDIINGLKSDQAEQKIINGLKVFTNLRLLEKCLDNIIETFLSELTQSLKDCYAGNDITINSIGSSSQKDSTRRGPGKTPTLTTSQNFRTKLWKSLNWLITDELLKYCQQILMLKKCLITINEVKYIYDESENNIQNKFWTQVKKLFEKSFAECPTHIKQTLQENLPKLLSSSRLFQNKIDDIFVFSGSVFASLEAGYLMKCGSNLKASILNSDTVLDQGLIDNLIKAATTEFNAAIVDQKLSIMVANVFNACNNDLWKKVEGHIKLGPDASQCIDQPNSVQLQNINLANLVYYHLQCIKKMIDDLGDKFSTTSECIKQNSQYAKNLINLIVQQLTDSMIKTIGIIFLSMHREPGLNDKKLDEYGPSLFMKEFQDFLQRTWNTHVLLYKDKQIIEINAENIAEKSIDLFVNNLCLLKPISLAGRKRLQYDAQHFESSLKNIVPNISNLKRSYRLLRAISSLIVKSAQELSEENIDKDLTPIQGSLILFLMFNFGGTDLQNPHTSCNWSNEKCIQWLSDHKTERERLELIAGALQKYRDSRKSSTQYDPVYPLLINFFQKIKT